MVKVTGVLSECYRKGRAEAWIDVQEARRYSALGRCRASRSRVCCVKRSHVPYFFTVAYSLALACVGIFGFQTLPPRFMDLFLIGIAFTTVRWSWRPAVLMYFFSLLVLVWALPPGGSFRVSEGRDQLRMALYGGSALAIILAIEFAKKSRGK